MMTTLQKLATFALLAMPCGAFTTPAAHPHQHLSGLVHHAAALEEVGTTALNGSDDPFDSYVAGTSTQVAVQVRTPGAGESEPAAEGATVVMQYVGRLLATGKQFADSGDKTLAFKVGGGNVIPGLDEGVRGQTAGAKLTLRIPPGKAYGDKGARSVIPPGSDLEFDVEIIKVASGVDGELELFGKGRAVAMFVCILGLALPPFFQ